MQPDACFVLAISDRVCVYWHWPSYFRGLRGRVPNLSNSSSQSSFVLKIHRKFSCLSGSCHKLLPRSSGFLNHELALVHLSAVIVGGTCIIPLSYPLVLPGHSGIASVCTKVPKYRMSFWSEFPYVRPFGHVRFVQLLLHPLLPKV